MEYELYGVFASHSPESCPLNNANSKEMFVKIKNNIETNLQKYKIQQIVDFYMSVLEHEWFIIVKAANSHEIENLCIEAGIASISKIKIIPLKRYEDVLSKIQKTIK